MDFHLKPWRDQQQHQLESEATEQNQQEEVEQSSVSSASANAASTPKLFLESPYSQPSSSSTAAAAGGSATTTLPLFVPEGGGVQQQQQEEEVKEEQDSAHPLTKFTNLSSAFTSSDHHSAPCRFPRNTNNRSYNCNNMESYFSLAQWQELELQALIYRYIVAGAAVPPELLQPIYFLHSNFSTSHHPPAAAFLHPGYWGRAAMDPEPGRCRRTDGKKWRCSRDVVAGQKYCGRHVHRGRNRSRKPVEILSPGDSATASPIMAAGAAPISAVVAAGGSSRLSFSRSSPTSSIDMLCLNQSYTSDVKAESKTKLFQARNHVNSRTDRHVLHHFFDDWPRSLQEYDTGTSESDVSLKLSTGNGNEPSSYPNRDQLPMSTWAARWSSNQVASMGSPLAEALRPPATTAHLSPTSVLNPLPRGSASEASFVSS